MPSNARPLELVQLLLMENASIDKFLDFQERFQSFINQSPSFLHSVGKEGFFPSFFFGIFAIILDTELATKIGIKKLYFRFDDNRTLKIAVLTSKNKLKCMTISDQANNNKNLKFSNDELEKIKQLIGAPPFDSYEKEEHVITIIGKEVECRKVDSPFSKRNDHSQKEFTTIEKTQDQQNLENLISKLNNQDSEKVKKNVGKVLDYITDVYKKYRKEEVPFSGKESSYHGFLAGFFMNFKYRFHLKLYLELFAGKGYADVILLVRGADKSPRAVPIIIELKAGTGDKSKIEAALKQAQDYVKGYFSNAIRIVTAAKEAICVGLNFEMANHGNVAIDVESFLDRKGNSVVEKLLDNSKKEEQAIAELIRKQLEYLYYGIVWSNGGSDNVHYVSQFILGQLMLVPDITDKEKSVAKYVFIRGQDVSKRTSRRNTNVVDKYTLNCVRTAVLIIDNEVFVLNITEMSKENEESLKATQSGNTTELEIKIMEDNKIVPIENIEGIKKIDNVKIHEINCHLRGTPSNKNPFDTYYKKDTGVQIRSYTLDQYKENRDLLQGNFPSIDKNKKFKAALNKAIKSGKYNDYKEVFKEISHILNPFKSLINNEAEFQAVLHGLFSSYSDDNIKVITEFQIGGGEKLDIMLIIQAIDKTTEHPPVGIELKFAKAGELDNKIIEAENQLERYQKGEAYKVVTDANKVELIYAVFDQGATNENEKDLIKVGDKFVSLEAKHSSDTMLLVQQPTCNIQQPDSHQVSTSRAVNQ